MKSATKFLGNVLLLSLLCFASNIPLAKGEGLNLEYNVSIEDPSNHILKVRLEILNINDEQLKLTRQTPYQTNPPILSMTVKDTPGSNIPYEIDNSVQSFESFVINSTGFTSLIIEYSIDLQYFAQDPKGGHSYWNLDASYGAVESQLVLLQPVVGSSITSCKVITSLPTGWKMVSRLIDQGNYFEANSDDKVIDYHTKYKFVMWGPIVFGEFDEYFRNIGGIEAEVAFYGDDNLQAEISKNIFSIIEYYTETIGSLNDPPNSTKPIKYLYVLLHETDRNVHCGDHIYGQFTISNEYNLQSRYMGDAHMIAHTWFSHFGLLSDVIDVAPWLEEGIIQFYALKNLEETGIWDSSEVNTFLIGWFKDYENYILGTQYDVSVFPATGWSDFPNAPLPSFNTYGIGIRHIIWYEKIPLVFRLLDWKIVDVTKGKKGFDDVCRYFHGHYDGFAEVSYNEILGICNYLSGHDFTNFFEKYISGNAPLPYYVENDTLKINYSQIPEPTPLSNLDFVRLRFLWGDYGVDADADGLSNELEEIIGTNFNDTDTDGDGLSDYEEFEVIVDGKSAEMIGEALISDTQGDSLSGTFGTDIKEVYASVFVNEDSERYLYLVMNLWDNLYNPDIFYEFYLFANNQTFQYRLHHDRSYLWKVENEQITQLPDDASEGKFVEQLEVIIPLVYLGNNNYTISAQTRYNTHLSMPLDSDITQDVVLQLERTIYITDPLNADTDGDYFTDYREVQEGTDPTDPHSYRPDGDVAPLGNADGNVTVGDALIGLRFALALETPAQEDLQHGDVAPLDDQGQPNPDGVINVGDALVILRKALGIISF